MILGIDPSQRHTGLCLLRETGPTFHEIQTEGLDVLSSAKKVKQELHDWLYQNCDPEHIEAFAPEKQLSVGGQSSSLMFFMQMAILEEIGNIRQNPCLIMPLPIQLQSYVKKKYHAPVSGRDYVDFFKKSTGYRGRISIHCVDAYYLAKLAQDVLGGSWRYKKPSKEADLTPWEITNGD